jgi:hypothetical protein
MRTKIRSIHGFGCASTDIKVYVRISMFMHKSGPPNIQQSHTMYRAIPDLNANVWNGCKRTADNIIHTISMHRFWCVGRVHFTSMHEISPDAPPDLYCRCASCEERGPTDGVEVRAFKKAPRLASADTRSGHPYCCQSASQRTSLPTWFTYVLESKTSFETWVLH